jgi:FAD/FMN-containing dehydrogenase
MLGSLSLWLLAASSLASAKKCLKARATLNDCLTDHSVPQVAKNTTGWNFETDPYNTRVLVTPAALVLPRTARHVRDTVICANKVGYNVSAKSGGHSYATFGLGGEDGHVVVDYKYMQNVTYDKASTIATILPGARLGNVALALNASGRATAHGTCPG